MVKLIKLLLGATLLLVLVVAVTVIAALLYFDPNAHKDFIISHVEKATGRSFAISGRINLSYYPWLGVEADGITLGNAKGFGDTPFLHAERVALRIKTMPLLQKHYELDTFRLHGLQLHLARNKEGVTNWSDLGGAGAAEKQKPEGALPFAAVVLGGVDVKDGQISWQDGMTGQTINITELNVSTGELTYGAPIKLVATMKASASKPALDGDLKLNGTLNYNLDTGIYALKPIDLVAKLTGESVPGGATNLVFKSAVESNLKDDTARIEDLSLDVLGTSVRGKITAGHIKSGKPQVQGDLAIKGQDLAPLLKLIESPAAKDFERLDDRSFDVRFNLDADLQSGRVQLPKFEASLLGASIHGNVEANNIQSGTPSAKGMLKATGPDLPALLQLAGQFETGKEPKLGEYGRRLARSPDRAFDIAVEFDADLKAGNIQVPTLAAKTLGFSVSGQLVAKDMNSDKGKVDGKFSLQGDKPADVLAALDQKVLADVLQAVSVDAGVSGTGGDITLQPLRVKATFAGKQIPNSPADVILNADTQFNLKKQTVVMHNMSLQGLGVDVSGDVTASKVQTNTPVISGKVNARGGDLALLFKLAGVEPLATQLAALDNRSFDIKSGLDADLGQGTVKVSNLDVRLLGATIQGQVDASNIRSKSPSARGKLKAVGPDLPALMQVIGQFQGKDSPLKNYGERLSQLADKSFDVTAEFDADPDKGNYHVPTLAAKTLGITLNGQLDANAINTNNGKVDGKFSLSGEKLSGVLAAVGQGALGEVLQSIKMDAGVKGQGGDIALSPLQIKATFAGKQIPNSPADVILNADTLFNLKKQTVVMHNVSLQGLGADVAGDVTASRVQTDTPAITGRINAKGSDLALLFKLAGIEPLATQLAALNNRSFDIKTGLDADLGQGTVKVSNLDARLLGATIQGQVDASNIRSKSPSARGKLKATGPDLPALMQVIGQFQGKDSPLKDYGERLSQLPDKSFDVTAEFDADPDKGNYHVPTLAAKTLGININGQLDAGAINSNNGKVDGKFSLVGEKISGVLVAMGQGALGEVLQSVRMDAGVKGQGGDIALSPLRVKATFAGKQIPNSPVDLTLSADTNANLDKQTLTINKLALQGLGLNVTANLSANRIKDNPDFSGDLTVAEFNLRQLAQQMNQTLPETADKNVFGKVALKTAFSGTNDSLNVKDLTAQLDDSKLNGNFSINHFTRPDIKFGVNIDTINADRYLPPSAKGKPVTPETVAAGAASELPLDTLRSLQISGDMQAGQFIISNAKLNNIKLALRAKDGDIRIDPASAELYQGKYQGSVALDVKGKVPIITVNSQLTTVQLEPLLKDYMQKPESPLVGVADLSFEQLTGSGMNAEQIKGTLTGKGKIKVTDGVLRGVDIHKALEQVEVMLESKIPGKVQAEGNTRFKELTGTLNIKNGVVTNNDLLMLADGFRVNQHDEDMLANLNNGTIKYDMKVAVEETRTTRGEKTYNIGGYKLPVRCRGQFSAPDCKPDAADIATLLYQKGGKDLLKDVLGIKTKKPAATSTGTEPQGAPEQQVAPDQSTTTETQPATEPQTAPAETQPAPTTKKKKKKSLEQQILEDPGKALKDLIN